MVDYKEVPWCYLVDLAQRWKDTQPCAADLESTITELEQSIYSLEKQRGGIPVIFVDKQRDAERQGKPIGPTCRKASDDDDDVILVVDQPTKKFKTCASSIQNEVIEIAWWNNEYVLGRRSKGYDTISRWWYALIYDPIENEGKKRKQQSHSSLLCPNIGSSLGRHWSKEGIHHVIDDYAMHMGLASPDFTLYTDKPGMMSLAERKTRWLSFNSLIKYGSFGFMTFTDTSTVPTVSFFKKLEQLAWTIRLTKLKLQKKEPIKAQLECQRDETN